MALIYITGISGSGKSEVLKELRARGYEAHGTDEDGISAFYDNQTGEKLAKPPETAEERTPEWRSRYTYKMDREQVKKLAVQAEDKPVYLCGVAANENEVWDLFAAAVALVIDEETLMHRITARTNNNFGKVPHELESILEWQRNTKENYRKFGHIQVDATKPVETVVDEILEKTTRLTK